MLFRGSARDKGSDMIPSITSLTEIEGVLLLIFTDGTLWGDGETGDTDGTLSRET